MNISNIIYSILIFSLIYNIFFVKKICEHQDGSKDCGNFDYTKCNSDSKIAILQKIIKRNKEVFIKTFSKGDSECKKEEICKDMIEKSKCKIDNNKLEYNKGYIIQNIINDYYLRSCNRNFFVGGDCNKGLDYNIVQSIVYNDNGSFKFKFEKKDGGEGFIKQNDKFYIKNMDQYVSACGRNKPATCSETEPGSYNISTNILTKDLWSLEKKDGIDGDDLTFDDTFIIINKSHNNNILWDCGSADGTGDCGHNISIKQQDVEKVYKWKISKNYI